MKEKDNVRAAASAIRNAIVNAKKQKAETIANLEQQIKEKTTVISSCESTMAAASSNHDQESFVLADNQKREAETSRNYFAMQLKQCHEKTPIDDETAKALWTAYDEALTEQTADIEKRVLNLQKQVMELAKTIYDANSEWHSLFMEFVNTGNEAVKQWFYSIRTESIAEKPYLDWLSLNSYAIIHGEVRNYIDD